MTDLISTIIQIVSTIATTASVMYAIYQGVKATKLNIKLTFNENGMMASLNNDSFFYFISITVYNKGNRTFHFGKWGLINNNGIYVILPVDELIYYYRQEVSGKSINQFEKLDLLDTKEHFENTLKLLTEKKLLDMNSKVIFFVDDVSGQRKKIDTKKRVRDFLEIKGENKTCR